MNICFINKGLFLPRNKLNILVLDSAKSYISGMVCEFSLAWAIIHNVVDDYS